MSMVGRLEHGVVALAATLSLLGCGPKFESSDTDAGTTGSEPPRDGLVYWFSADSGVSTDSGRVAKWTNRVGNGLDAIQLTEDNRPKLDKLGDTNHTAIRFDGEDDFLGMQPITTTFERGVSVFSVARSEGAEVCMAILELSNGPEIDDISFDWIREALLQYEVFNDTLQGQSGAFSVDEPRLLEAIHEPSGDLTLWVNGVTNGIGSFGLPVNVPRNQNFVGRTMYQNCSTWAGEIGEILFYSRALEPTERQSVESYLDGKWGL